MLPAATLAALEENLPPLASVPREELYDIPSLPMSSLTPEQCYRAAQLIDTALFKAYLAVRPSLVGSLCRLENFCDVSEVEQELRDRKVPYRHRDSITPSLDVSELTDRSLRNTLTWSTCTGLAETTGKRWNSSESEGTLPAQPARS